MVSGTVLIFFNGLVSWFSLQYYSITTNIVIPAGLICNGRISIISSTITTWSSHPLYMFLILNLIVILVAFSSRTDLYHYYSNNLKTDDHDEYVVDGTASTTDDVVVASLSTSPPPPPLPPPQQQQQRCIKQSHGENRSTPTSTSTSRTTWMNSNCAEEEEEEEEVISKQHDKGNTETEQTLEETWKSIMEGSLGKTTTPQLKRGKKKKKKSLKIIRQKEEEREEEEEEEEEEIVEDHQAEVVNTENEQTLEETWKSIMEGSLGKTMTSQLKKRDVPQRMSAPKAKKEGMAWRDLRNCDKLNDAWRRGGLRRGTSLSLEELNHGVEAFIKNFYHHIRLQRRDSYFRFMRGA
ncbi:hypothetical protein Acr_14g0000170 [Actinidia rufa]|uniref:DUF4408 domain-containing protein n=1 Tax=Actinidia rufa TaxID=165716 RepID=A0A7J0FP03_9ERIC|nr:hypothetical protein Acr_14g0000170 [Actinidia rufa]